MRAMSPIKDRKKVLEMLNFLRNSSPRDALMFQTGINTVLKISDLLRLKVSHVAHRDLSPKKYIDIEKKKHNRIFITSKLAPVLQAYIARYELQYDDYLFFRYTISGNAEHIEEENKPISKRQASYILVRAAKACNIENFNTESMRKTHAFDVYEATNHNIGLVQSILKQQSPTLTLKYLGITLTSMDDAKELIGF